MYGKEKIYFIVATAAALFFLALAVKKQLGRKKRKRLLKQIGRQGEEDTKQVLEKIKGYKRILKNVYIPLSDGKNTTEIDLLVIHIKGIFVVENKNYSGWVYGDGKKSRWLLIQRQGQETRKKYFYSPVLQNQSHIHSLSRFLEAQFPWNIPYYSVVTFNSRAVLKRIRRCPRRVLVTESGRAAGKLSRRLFWMPRKLNRKQVDQLAGQLEEQVNPGRRVEKRHEKYAGKHNFFSFTH